MDLYQTELVEAHGRIVARGRRIEDFTFAHTFLPPDPDGAGMFTVTYEVTTTSVPTGKSLDLIGGIGLRWVDRFDDALSEGYFD